MLKAQLSVWSSVRERDHLANCLQHLGQIKSQLEDREETSVLVKLQLLNDPARFLVSRLLDPHLLLRDAAHSADQQCPRNLHHSLM